ncbi:MAG: GlxA family transcriptional regulator [Planktomarina sp.]
MHKWTSQTQTLRILIWVFPNFSNHCLANTVEPLRAANDFTDGQAYRWTLVSLNGGGVPTSSGLTLATEKLSDVSGDMLVVMPSYDYQTHATVQVSQALRAQRASHLVGLDTGAWLLAKSGLLKDRTATIHWDVIEAFAEQFPDIDVVQDRVVTDRNITTCGGAARAFDWVTSMIGDRQGQSVKAQVTGLFQGNRSAPFQGKGLDKMLAIMRENLERPLPLSKLAQQLDIGQKTLERACRVQLGTTPAKAYQFLRLTHAKDLLETRDLSVAEVAIRSGYANASAMTRAFKTQFAVTPQHIKSLK